MKRILLPLLFLSLALCAFAQTLSRVQAKGYGETRDLALKDAMRGAVEQTVGIVIGAETVVQNFALVSDKILSKSLGYVRGYSIIEERREIDGEWLVHIDAEVGEILDAMIADELAVRALLDWMQKPRVMVLLAEKNLEDSESVVAETAVTRSLLDLGFDVVDRNAVDWSRAREIIETFGQLDRDRMAAVVSGATADLIFAGRARATPGQASGVVASAGLASVQAVLSGRLYRIDTGRVLSVHQTDATKAHVNSQVAGASALEQAALAVAHEVLKEVLQKWAALQTQSLEVEVEVRGMDFRQQSAFIEHLRSQAIVKSVTDRGLQGGVFRCEVQLDGRARNLAMLLDGFSAGGKSWMVETLSERRLVLAPE